MAMTKPQLSSQISIGNMISTAAMLVAIGVSFGALRSQNAQTQLEVERLDARMVHEVQERRAADIRIQSRVRVVENIQARNDERFVSVLDELERIDGRLNQVLQNIEGQQR